MKKLSIGTKITLWFSAALIVVVALTFFVILKVSGNVLQKTIRDNLVETVENNVDEVEYYKAESENELINSNDYYIRYGEGFLEVDDDFLNEVNDVHTSLCSEEGTLLYGDNPIMRETSMLSYNDSQIQKVTVEGILYYIYDRKLSMEGLEKLWLRGVVAETQGDMQLASITKTSLILFPLLNVIAIIGGYIIARRMLKPIKYIADTANNIRQGGDLKKHIEIGKGNDELHELADSFNEMFDRLDESFFVEKQFTSDASHELRTPIAVIMSQCELVLEQTQTQEEYIEALETIQRQGRKMSKLINDMLDYTRLEFNPERFINENVNFSDIVKSACKDMNIIKEKKIIIHEDVQEEVYISGNRELLSRLVVNLLNNACKYGKDNGNVYVTLKVCDEDIYFVVKDDGIGIKDDEIEKIFQRFYQSDNSRSTEGTGLGLAMVKEIVKHHSATIDVESVFGEGSTFICKF